MPDRIPIIATVRVLHADPVNGSVFFIRALEVPEVPQVGDHLYVDSAETRLREVTHRDWGFDGTPNIRLATMSTIRDAMSGPAASVEELLRDGWKRDPVQSKS